MELKALFVRIKQWIFENYLEDPNQAKVVDMVWLKINAKPGDNIDWNFVDTVDYNIDSIPRTREIVIDFKTSPHKIMEKCQNMLKNYQGGIDYEKKL
ncbi:MAG: hypothetical protein KAS15_02630 [Nanoarchaeota archaeon]|nr:hypothetical protein [Nanoarchaeota archaeon]